MRTPLTHSPPKLILVAMVTDEFTRLFKYMEKRFDRIDKQFDETNAQIDNIIDSLNALAKSQEIDEEERLVMGHQLERLDQWTHQLAEKIGVQLSI